MSKRVAIVTGSNKGIGFSIVKQLCKEFDGVVYLTARNTDLGQKAVEQLNTLGLHPSFHQLDVESKESILTFRDYLQKTYGGIDVLIQNAGVYLQVNDQNPAGKVAKATMSINYYGVLNLSDALFPLLRPNARVVNVASKLGLLTRLPAQSHKDRILNAKAVQDVSQIVEDYVRSCENGTQVEDGYPKTAYEMSKVALITVTQLHKQIFNADSRPGIIINAVCPGYCATDLNNHSGYLTADQGAITPSYLAQIKPDATKGGEFWSEMKTCDWHNETIEF